MRAVRLAGLPHPIEPNAHSIEPRTRVKTIPDKMMPSVAKKNKRKSRQPRPISGFGPSGRTIAVRLVTASSSLAYQEPEQLG